EHNRGLSRQPSERSSVTSHSSYDRERTSPEPTKLPAIAEQNGPPITRAFSEPYQVNYVQGWPGQAVMPGLMVPSQFIQPPFNSLQQPSLPASLPNSLPGTPSPPPPTMLPIRPRYQITNPDPGTLQPAELPGD